MSDLKSIYQSLSFIGLVSSCWCSRWHLSALADVRVRSPHVASPVLNAEGPITDFVTKAEYTYPRSDVDSSVLLSYCSYSEHASVTRRLNVDSPMPLRLSSLNVSAKVKYPALEIERFHGTLPRD